MALQNSKIKRQTTHSIIKNMNKSSSRFQKSQSNSFMNYKYVSNPEMLSKTIENSIKDEQNVCISIKKINLKIKKKKKKKKD